MKTRLEDLEDAVKEALQMLARGLPADAQETLSAALDAPTDDRAVRDAALEEAAQEFDRIASASAGTMYAKVVADHAKRTRALQSAPAQVVSKVSVELVMRWLWENVLGSDGDTVREAARRLGVDLDAAPAKPLPPTACGEIVDGEPCRRWDGHEGVCDSEGSR